MKKLKLLMLVLNGLAYCLMLHGCRWLLKVKLL